LQAFKTRKLFWAADLEYMLQYSRDVSVIVLHLKRHDICDLLIEDTWNDTLPQRCCVAGAREGERLIVVKKVRRTSEEVMVLGQRIF
jgi:hypothetical protein